MRFIGILAGCFALIYALIAVHYLNFDRIKREENLANLAQNVRDVQLSTTFISPDYKGFVYAK